MEIIRFNHVGFFYDPCIPILEDIDLAFCHDDFVSIVGPNGGGKTTLIKIMLGLIAPTSGNITILGKAPCEMRHKIGYMPQQFHHAGGFPITVHDVVLTGRLGHTRLGHYSKSDKKAADFALERLDLLHVRDHLFATLSGGQQRRALIARALACAPAILMLDEPTANIDAPSEQAFFTVLKQLAADMAILMVSHDMHFVSRLATKVLCINRGAFVHSPAELIDARTQRFNENGLRLVFHQDGGHTHRHDGAIAREDCQDHANHTCIP